MADQNLLDFIIEQSAHGTAEADIRTKALSKGWSEGDVNGGLATFHLRNNPLRKLTGSDEVVSSKKAFPLYQSILAGVILVGIGAGLYSYRSTLQYTASSLWSNIVGTSTPLSKEMFIPFAHDPVAGVSNTAIASHGGSPVSGSPSSVPSATAPRVYETPPSASLSVSGAAAPTVTIRASVLQVLLGQPVVLTWMSSNATRCTSPDIVVLEGQTSGTMTVEPTSGTSYAVSCTGPGGTQKASVSIQVILYSGSSTTPPPSTPPTPTVPPPTPSPGTYPASVVTTGLQNVWNLRNTAGLQSIPTHTPANTSLPPGVATATEAGQAMLRISQNVNFDGWDFTGWRVTIYNSPTVTFTNSKFSNPNGYALLDMGVEDTGTNGGNITCTHCEFDMHGIIEFYESPIRDGGTTTFTVLDSYLHDTSRDDITVTSPNTFTAMRNYLTAPGLNSQVGDHIEAIHLFYGTSVISQNLFDMTNGAGKIVGGLTGVVYPEAYTGTLVATLDRNIFVGSKAIGLLYVLQMGNKVGMALTVNLTNNLFELGTSAAMGRSGGLLNMTGNYDFTTGLPIPDGTLGSPLAAVITADMSAFTTSILDVFTKISHFFGYK